MRMTLGLIGSLVGCALLAQGCASEAPLEPRRATESKLADGEGNDGEGSAKCSDTLSVTRSYEMGMLREPDAGGLQYYLAALRAGTISRLGVLQTIATSPEALQTRAAQSNEQFVGTTYVGILHRVPDPAGLEYWVSALESGAATRSEMVLSFIASDEFADPARNPEHVCHFG